MAEVHTIQNLRILNWNADGLKTKRAITIDFLQRHNIDIACISESHLIPDENLRSHNTTYTKMIEILYGSQEEQQ